MHAVGASARDRKGEEARVLFGQLAENDFAIFPKDNEWLFVMILLAEAALTLEDDAKLLVLYELLLPYNELVALAASEVSVGPVSLTLGKVAARLGDHDEAGGSFRESPRSLATNAGPALGRSYLPLLCDPPCCATVRGIVTRRSSLVTALQLSDEIGMPVLTERIQLALAPLGARPRRRMPDGRRIRSRPRGLFSRLGSVRWRLWWPRG